jgi:hypothetical protein
MLEWVNPHKDKKVVKSVDFIGSNKGVPLLLGITLGTKHT